MMAHRRARINAPYLSLETLAHANARVKELGASSMSVLLEALLHADMESPCPRLGAIVAKIEKQAEANKSACGSSTIEANRESRWPDGPSK